LRWENLPKNWSFDMLFMIWAIRAGEYLGKKGVSEILKSPSIESNSIL